MASNKQTYDIIILGDTAEGITAALTAAQMCLRVALVGEPKVDSNAPVSALMFNQELALEGVDTYHEQGYFLNSNIVVAGDYLLHAEKINVATGTNSRRPASFSFDGNLVMDVDEALMKTKLPSTMILVGNGNTGTMATKRFANRGVNIILVAPVCPENLPAHITFQQGEVIGAEANVENNQATVQLANGSTMTTEVVVVNVGRIGNTASLNLAAADLLADDCGRLWCNSDYQTWESHIFGLGDVAGVWDKQDDLQKVINQILTLSEIKTFSEQMSLSLMAH